MRLLFVHSDHLEFEATSRAGEGDIAETEGVPMEGRMEECVTAFVTVESEDQADLDAVADEAVAELVDVTDQLNTRRVVLYPYAHLSEDLAAPDAARELLVTLEAELEGRNYEVLRAPFGWYKSVEVSCKGHPLSDLSRHVSARRDPGDQERAPGDWHLLTPDGDRRDPVAAKADLDEDLRAFVEHEIEDDNQASAGEPADHGSAGEPAHVELMAAQSLAGHDDLSDAGNLRWYPRGKLVRDLLMDYVNDLVVDYGGMPVETPVMYDLGARAISEHADTFGERQYRVESGDRRLLLRVGACFGQLSLMRDMDVAESDLPLRLYELSTYSFRREQRGELGGLGRLRAFTTPDVHTATRDLAAAREELLAQAELAVDAGEDLGIDYVPVVRTTRDVFADDRAWLDDLVETLSTPAVVEVLPERRHAWSTKVDFAAIDGRGRPIENATVRIDVDSAERFDVEYADGEASHHPPILHCSPTGGIERVLATLLEHAAAMDTPRLPTWLAPTQVRLVPVAPEHVDHCDDLADRLAERDVRADVDDRDETVGTRIARAETDWVPYYAVVGDRERDGDALDVNVRATGQEPEMTVAELVAAVEADVDDRPRRPRYLPKHVSDHPNFTGC